MPDGIVLTPAAGIKAFGNETVGQLTTNPPSPTLDARAQEKERRYQRMSGFDRFVSVNEDAVKSIGSSLDAFVHHPVKSLVPAIAAGASSSVSPFLHPVAAAQNVGQYFKNRGPIDGMSQAAYTATNAATVCAIVGGAACAGAAFLRVPGAAKLMPNLLSAIKWLGLTSLGFNGAQWAYDEAQAAAPESGVKLPKWLPLVGGKPLFGKTTHQQQVQLVKFDALNVGGSAITWGVARFHEAMNASKLASSSATSGAVKPMAGSNLAQTAKKVLASNATTYGAMGLSMGGIVAGSTPTGNA